MDTDLATEKVSIETLALDPANARVHPDRNLDAIKSSLKRFGQQKPIVVDGDGIVRAGNGTLEAARQLGWKEIAIVRTKLRGAEAIAFAIADNRTSDLSHFDDAILGRQIDALLRDRECGINLDELGFNDKELDALLKAAAEEDRRDLDDPGPLAVVQCVSQTGDLWNLGEHRLLCGDSLKIDDVNRVMAGDKSVLLATDPPYGVDYKGDDRPVGEGQTGKGGKNWEHVYREIDIENYPEFFRVVMQNAVSVCIERLPVYVWHADRQINAIRAGFDANGLLLHQIIIWYKPRPLMSHAFFRYRHEPCAFGWRQGFRPNHGDLQIDSVWEVDWDGKKAFSTFHPTSKPTRLFELPMELHTRPGDVVFEPFNGSGSQIVAAERMTRRCRAIEMVPNFVDGTVLRWQIATGKQARLDGTNDTFEEVAKQRGVKVEYITNLEEEIA